jgi:RND family efflux transporter MFP subunit
MIRIRWETCLFGLVALAPRAGADDGPPPSADVIELRRCPVEYARASLLGPSLIGVVQEISARPGDVVKAGQVLGTLQDKDVRAELDLRTAEAETDIGVRIGKARLALAVSKLKNSESLNLRNFVSREELQLHRIEAEARALEVEEAEHKRKLAEIQRRQAEAMARARQFIAPFDGIVVAVLKEQGESVGPSDPVFRVVDTDHLKVTGHLDVVDAWRAKVGLRVRVHPEVAGADLPVEREVFSGRIAFVDTQVDPATQTCKVVAEVENRDGLLRAGMEARLELIPDSGAGDTAGARDGKAEPERRSSESTASRATDRTPATTARRPAGGS